ncbi:hypothetical protein GCM10010191_42990 [Actinomadura vinacea]|uniref:Alpha/beta fold hydrolase n=1 Tax=Actinomadura vinacea TaxID=115336 RepID=A0ABN3JCN1_9ACTN
MRWRIAVAASATWAGLCLAPASADSRHECADATEQCKGTISVPLDWNDPGSERISVGFAWVPRTDLSRPARGTVLVHPGGFGAYTSGAAVFQEVLGPALRHQNLLIVDMRGTGNSSPIRCVGLDVRKPETIRACAGQLGERGRFYSTDQSVKDMNAVRAALGVPKVTFYGGSYGTVFGQAFAARFPRHLAAILLDSTDPMRADGYGTALRADVLGRGLADLDVVCDASPACRALPGTADDRLTTLVERLRESPDEKVPLAALAQVVQKKGADAVLGREVNAAIAAYLNGDPKPLRRLSEPILPLLQRPGMPVNEAETAALPFSCNDFAFPFDRLASPEKRQRQLDKAYAENPPVAPFTVDEVFGFMGGSYPQWCVPWPTSRPSPPVPPGAAYPDVPALVIGGELDPGMGSREATAVARRFPRGTAVTVPFGGHLSTFGGHGAYSLCVRDLMRSFIADPGPVRDPGCSAETYRAIGSFPRTLAQVRPATGSPLDREDARLVSAAFATVNDALTRRAPEAAIVGRISDQAGLRGGRLILEKDTPSVRLEQTRFVSDLAVTGQAAFTTGNQATAKIQTRSRDRSSTLTLTWKTLRPESTTHVTGTLNGHPFSVFLGGHPPARTPSTR